MSIFSNLYNIIRDWWRGIPLGRASGWSALSRKYREENPHCAVCGTLQNVEVHHVIPYHIDPQLELQEFNLISLCRHDHFLFGHLGSWHSYNREVRADAAEMRGKIETRP